nr:right-handed parallel beta-helix repeat-containing protein [Butyrivibrio sp.]
ISGSAEKIIIVKNTSNDVIDGNICNGNGSGTIRGIILTNVSNSTISNNTIKNVTKSNGTCIFSESSSGNSIENNKAFISNKFGILIKDSAETSVSGNLIYKFSTDGIAVQNSTIGSVNDNVIAGSGKDGILVYKKSTVTEMKNNNISDIKRHGIILTTKGVIKTTSGNIIDSKKASFDISKGCKAAGFDFGTSLGVGEKVSTKGFGPRDADLSVSSSKSGVASISDGSLSGKSKGKTKFKAKTKGAKGITTVKVGSKPTSVSVAESSVTLSVGEIYNINPSVNSGAGCCTYKYKSSKKGVAAVTKTGVIEAKSAGTATITVKTYNGKKTTLTVTVQ